MTSVKKPAKAVVVTLIVMCTFVGLAALVAAARTWGTSPLVKQVEPIPIKAAPERTRPIADFESELITITPHGFEPGEITRPKGRFLLMIDNRSGVAATALALTSEAGQRVREMGVGREQPNWSEAVDLRPGRYVLTETEHPDWSCQITITAR